MNNISQISKAKRLTEEEVHAAAEELQLNGGKVGSIEIYRFLGRGSLTTITNFLKTWHQEEKEAALPALIMPETLKKSAEQLIIKVWCESQALAEQELKSQQEALRQAEALANKKITEAEAFSEEQAAQIEALETKIEELKKEIQKQYESYLKEIRDEQDTRHQAVIKEAVSAEKLREAEKRFDYVNATLIKQQQANQTLTAENIALKTKLETAIEKLREKTASQENKIKLLKTGIEDERKARELDQSNNKILIEKAAKLEGELIAWKSIKPETKKAIETKIKEKPLTKNQQENQ